MAKQPIGEIAPADKAGVYAAIVAEVKESFTGRDHTGDDVAHEISRCWATANGRKWEEPTRSALDPDAGPSVPGKQSKVKLPDRAGEETASLKDS